MFYVLARICEVGIFVLISISSNEDINMFPQKVTFLYPKALEFHRLSPMQIDGKWNGLYCEP